MEKPVGEMLRLSLTQKAWRAVPVGVAWNRAERALSVGWEGQVRQQEPGGAHPRSVMEECGFSCWRCWLDWHWRAR